MNDAPRRFYTERVPEQFNRTLEAAHADGGDEGALYRALTAVDTTLEIRVDGAEGSPYFLNVDAGHMEAGTSPAHAPLMVLCHDLGAFAAIERESGDSALGFLGGMAGLGRELRLTRARVAALRQVDGTVRFSVTGEGGFTLCARFGGGEPAEPADCEVSIDRDVHARLRAGEIDAQDAFMSGKVDIAGDMQRAMQLALAVVSPD